VIERAEAIRSRAVLIWPSVRIGILHPKWMG
jgi:hypothetical protein